MSHPGQHSPNAGVPHQSPPLSDGPSQQQAPRVRRRNRLINSCLECRRRKLKCDKGSPCSNCTKNARSCVFIASGLDADAQARLAEVKEKMGMLERSLEQDVAQKRRSKPEDASETKSPNTLPGQESYSDQEDDDETRNLDPSTYATEDANYYDDDGDEDIVDLGIAMGKVRITERIGGLVRPRFNEELAQALKELPKSEHGNPNPVSAQNPQDWLAPSLDYVAPSSSFFFAQGIEKTSLRTYLPARPLVDRLIAHYWEAVHVIARTVHRPTFLRQYDKFWLNINANIEPRNSFQAVLFAAMLSSAISMSESRVLAEFGVHKESLVDNFRQGTEAALARANFLRTTRLETIQAFVMYLIPLCRNEISRAHSALTGMLIRLAECMGLHRDPTGYSSSPVEIHVRRLVWYQICFLDLRTCEATGPRPQIRPDDYDTRFPLNIDDVDLDRAENGERGVDVTKDRTYFTDMTITRMRFEGYEMHRLLWNERPKLERRRNDGERKVTLTSLLARVQAFSAAMEKTYVPMLNKTVPLHFLATEIHGIISNRLYILLLQKYMSSDRIKMPPRLRQVVISSAIMTIEHAMNIEQQPALATWSWYSGALQQYHAALLLLSELYASSNEPALEKRVWHCLDFAFGLPAERSSQDKTRFILEDLVEKTEIYASMKKLRVPTNIPLIGPRTYTPGYHARQREERERSGSVQSAGSGSVGTSADNPGMGVSPVSQQTSPPPPPSTQAIYNHPPTLIAFPGAVPTVDWGTPETSTSLPASLPVPAPVIQQPPVSTAPFNFNDFTPSAPVGGLMPPVTLGQRPGSDAGSPAVGAYGNVPGWTPGSSPMDALSELDWNDIEQMFGGSDVASGMLIPPYSFPQFAPGDVQWTT